VMELADCSLRDLFNMNRAQGRRGIPGEELLPFFRDAAEGLDWLHARNLIHRDIKPENILLIEGYAKIADFGLAPEQPVPTNKSVTFAGPPAYLAPEVWSGQTGARSDQYSLALTYAELRLGRRPLGGADFLQAMNGALEGAPDLTGLGEAEQAVLRRALAK